MESQQRRKLTTIEVPLLAHATKDTGGPEEQRSVALYPRNSRAFSLRSAERGKKKGWQEFPRRRESSVERNAQWENRSRPGQRGGGRGKGEREGQERGPWR